MEKDFPVDFTGPKQQAYSQAEKRTNKQSYLVSSKLHETIIRLCSIYNLFEWYSHATDCELQS